MRKPVKKSKGVRSFNPVEIISKIQQAINLDLNSIDDTVVSPIEAKFVYEKQSNEFLKKFVTDQSRKDSLHLKAFVDFEKLNNELGEGSFLPFPSVARLSKNHTKFDKILLVARSVCHSILGSLDEDEWFSACQHSSGTSIGVPYTATNVEDKWKFPLSATGGIRSLFTRYLAWYPRFREYLLRHNQSIEVEILEVNGSRGTTVDKNDVERRFICIEPTLNMFFQQGLMTLMYDRLQSFGLDVSRAQNLHRELAYFASVFRRIGTIDWSKASDRSRTSLCAFLFPSQWFSVLDLVRSPSMDLNGSWVDLNMISTMGNATTFPVETLIFYSLGVATMSVEDGHMTLFPDWKYFKSMHVFGDDCILPTTFADTFVSVCEGVGFVCNRSKSFYDEGEAFRESCGADFLRGRNVRIAYAHPPTSNRLSALEPWLYTLLNVLTKKYISYFGELDYVYNKALYRCIFATFHEFNLSLKIVPHDYPDDSGFKQWDLRMAHAYKLPKVSPIHRSKSGLFRFSFLRFSYRNRSETKVNPDFRYSLWLQGKHSYRAVYHVNDMFSSDTNVWPLPKRKRLSIYEEKRIGGYVVSKGLTHIPFV